MITIMFTLSIGLTALMFVLEKKEGLLERNWVAGVSTIEIMSSHITAKFFIMLVQLILILIIPIFAFDVNFFALFISLLIF
jgi:hypothetical protein